MFNKDRHHRQSIRLRQYDYAQSGAYFVTICTQERACLFGVIEEDNMHLNDAGRMVQAVWTDLPNRYPGVEIDAFIVMPNHVHGIVSIVDNVGAPLVGAHHLGTPVSANHDSDGDDRTKRAPTRGAPTLGNIIGGFKSIATVEYGRGVAKHAWPAFSCRLWQRIYHEHIIRNEKSLTQIRQYIEENPHRWDFDHENPASQKLS